MPYQVFYTSYSLQESVSSSSPRLLDADQLKTLSLRILKEEEDFLGVIDNEDRVIQFMRSATDDFLVEIPDLEAKNSLQRHLSTEETLELIARLPSILGNLDLSPFDLVAWADR
jgi:hypothetical protein